MKGSQSQAQHLIVKCPQCLKMSVAWFEQHNNYECMNPKCNNMFSKEEYEQRIQLLEKALSDNPKGKAWFGNSYFDSKKKKWKKA